MIGRDRWARRECRYGAPSGRALPLKKENASGDWYYLSGYTNALFRMTSLYQSALSFGVRCWVSKSL
jgi:hypothetical protein